MTSETFCLDGWEDNELASSSLCLVFVGLCAGVYLSVRYSW